MDAVPLRLTAAQRRLAADALPQLHVDWFLGSVGSRTLFVDDDAAAEIERTAREQFYDARGTARNSWGHIAECCHSAIARKAERKAEAETVLQFKITLLDVKPAVWRRIQVRGGTLDDLHGHIQTAMGWKNSHLHQFEIDGRRYGDPRLLDFDFEPFDGGVSTVARLHELASESGKTTTFRYEYDFGDCWRHDVRFEGFMPVEPGVRYPICLDGRRACPPEDVGGTSGYEEFLRVLRHPSHEEYEHYRQWAPGFDPRTFSAEAATKSMRRGVGWIDEN